MRPACLLAFAVVALGFGSGCASTRMGDYEADRLFRERRFDEASERLRKGLEDVGEDGRDGLLYELDLGLALHTAGKYEESTKVFLQADKAAEIKDYTSLASEASTFLVSDNTKVYKGEDFENVLINTYLSINYALMGKEEDAIVEAKRVNRKLERMVTEGERKYKQNAFSRYLTALIYEDQKNWNDAFIEYKLIEKLMPGFPGLGRDLWRTATLSGIRDQADDFAKEYHLNKQEKDAARELFPKQGKGEVVVIFQNGFSPVKRPHPSFYSIPKFYPRSNPVTAAAVQVDGEERGRTHILHDVESTAIENLDEKYAGIIAKKVGGVVAKEIAGNAIGNATGNDMLGALTKLVLYAADQADLRSWYLLPKDFQIARVPLAPGKHRVKVVPLGGGETLYEQEVEVVAGRKAFLNVRYVP